MRKKIILMVGGTETLDYFSRQLAKGFQMLGFRTFLYDQQAEEENSEALARFAGFSDSILVTFNFEGIHFEPALYDGNGQSFWEKREIPCVNIAVDHPFYYPDLLKTKRKNFYEISIDRFHLQYMKQYYPDIPGNYFLPLGGTSLFPDGNYPPLSKRKYDVVFTGNFTPKETFDCHIDRLGEEYAVFYRSIIEELIQNPKLPNETVIEKHLKREFPEISREELAETIPNMIFIDTYLRFYFREKAVQALADAGIHVHCVGFGWEKLPCKHPENLTYEGNKPSLSCLKRISDAKLSLNVMPWFKDGAHDRVFNAMANGSICITDHSRYLDEILSDKENVIFYDLEKIGHMPEKVKSLLNEPEKMEYIAQNGYRLAIENHTWFKRAETLCKMLLYQL